MALTPITTTIPQEYRNRLLEGEEAYDFSTFEFKRGCISLPGTAPSGQSWIVISNRRVIYEGWVLDVSNIYRRSSGSIPIAKISYVSTGTTEPPKGCKGILSLGCAYFFVKPTHTLKIVSAGGELNFRVPTEADAQRLQALVDQLATAQ